MFLNLLQQELQYWSTDSCQNGMMHPEKIQPIKYHHRYYCPINWLQSGMALAWNYDFNMALYISLGLITTFARTNVHIITFKKLTIIIYIVQLTTKMNCIDSMTARMTKMELWRLSGINCCKKHKHWHRCGTIEKSQQIHIGTWDITLPHKA